MKDNIIEFSKDDITFYGDTEEERKLNELLFDSTMENDRLHQEINRLNNIIDELEEWLNEAYEYLLFTDTSKILRNLKEQMDKYGYFHDLGSINDVVGCIEKVKSKLKELKEK